ncbi:hypothetical protein IPH25_00305 [bacterium]|nr:MAG: hypothetical protein IPG37_02420 [bacterium]QQR61875.1 MAG: hypothetical protein IPH25_00305 [bacterium]QQR62540.1 MAG: hypothetical protein IPH67_03915 [bacterium]
MGCAAATVGIASWLWSQKKQTKNKTATEKGQKSESNNRAAVSDKHSKTGRSVIKNSIS